jgi:katanin p60 ATPase-containing subunit A1
MRFDVMSMIPPLALFIIYSGHVFVLVATNTPWDIDPAFLRRLEKRILIPMPTTDARKMMIKYHLSNIVHCALSEDDYDHFAKLTDGFSGADIKLFCKEAAMRPIREIILEMETHNPKLVISRNNNTSMEQICQKLLSRHPLHRQHLERSISSLRHSVRLDLCQKYTLWDQEFGSH